MSIEVNNYNISGQINADETSILNKTAHQAITIYHGLKPTQKCGKTDRL